jgi:hypothetical protein
MTMTMTMTMTMAVAVTGTGDAPAVPASRVAHEMGSYKEAPPRML